MNKYTLINILVIKPNKKEVKCVMDSKWQEMSNYREKDEILRWSNHYAEFTSSPTKTS